MAEKKEKKSLISGMAAAKKAMLATQPVNTGVSAPAIKRVTGHKVNLEGGKLKGVKFSMHGASKMQGAGKFNLEGGKLKGIKFSMQGGKLQGGKLQGVGKFSMQGGKLQGGKLQGGKI
jgi:hypothetical protein